MGWTDCQGAGGVNVRFDAALGECAGRIPADELCIAMVAAAGIVWAAWRDGEGKKQAGDGWAGGS